MTMDEISRQVRILATYLFEEKFLSQRNPSINKFWKTLTHNEKYKVFKIHHEMTRNDSI